TFRSPGAGQGPCIKNNAAAVWNRTSRSVRVYYNSNSSGAYVTVPPGGWGNLPINLQNQNASHKFL
ncbi:peptidase inhibitor family I36 protein, partial [Luteipulveratus halotolerans]